MSKTDIIGRKRICSSCSAKFYDLGKNPAACPKCKTMNDINAQVRVRRKSKAVVEVDNDDPLIKQKAKQDAKQKNKRVPQEIEGVDLEEFDDVELADSEDEIEEIEEVDDIEDIEDLEELEDVEPEEEMDDDIVLDDDSLIDEIDDEEAEEFEEEEEEEEAPKPSKKSASKSTAKPEKNKKK